MLNYVNLTADQIWGDNQLDVFKERGTQCEVTDAMILNGGYVSEDYHSSKGNKLENRTCYYWSASLSDDDSVRVVGHSGGKRWHYQDERYVAVRPALMYSNILESFPNGVRELENGDIEISDLLVEKNVPSKVISKKLEQLWGKGELKIVGTYPRDTRRYDKYDKELVIEDQAIYELDGKKYIRKEANLYTNDGNDPTQTLSNGEKVRDGETKWVEANPAIGWHDKKTSLVVFEGPVTSGVRWMDIPKFFEALSNSQIQTNRNVVENEQQSDYPEQINAFATMLANCPDDFSKQDFTITQIKQMVENLDLIQGMSFHMQEFLKAQAEEIVPSVKVRK